MSKPIELYANALRGLGRVTARELKHLFGGDLQSRQAGHTRNVDIIQFKYDGPHESLLQIGTTEDVFALICELDLSGDREKDLLAIAELSRQKSLTRVVEYAKLFRGRPSKRIRFRAVVQASDADWRLYRRNEMQASLVEAINMAYPKWKPVDDEADFEFWLQQTDRAATIGVRLSDATMRHRTYKMEHMPGSLRPTVARAMAFLGRPQDNDVIVDPVCGLGTTLIERALAGRCKMLLGGDGDYDVSESAMVNFGRKHRPRLICHWDAERLPIADESVHVVLANLPWGHRIAADIGPHYAGVLREAERILKSQGRAVFLTDQSRALVACLSYSEQLFELERITDVSVLGREADIFVVQKI
ncbi:MAG: methyltransferase domain-containing protein [Candidatus Latescibacteria bacterium]|nr:methyltransferase domain-containing protein [Candidatus Latescibacterota bacterium]